MDLLAEIFEDVGVEYEVLDPERAVERWPQFAFDTDVLWHPDAGVIDAETTVTTMLERAVDTGRARILSDWTVAEVTRRSAGGFRVTSGKGDIVEGDRVIVAAGGWLPDLLGDLGLPEGFLDALPRFEVRQEQAFHMPYRDAGEVGRLTTPWPTFIHKSGEMFTYGLPGGRDAGFAGQKLAQFNGGEVIRSALDQDGQITGQMRARMIDYAKRNLPGLIPEPYAETTCLFTNTPNEDFVIDEVNGLVIVSACSGHGAKFAPLLGEFAADLAMGAGEVPDRFRVSGVSS